MIGEEDSGTEDDSIGEEDSIVEDDSIGEDDSIVGDDSIWEDVSLSHFNPYPLCSLSKSWTFSL